MNRDRMAGAAEAIGGRAMTGAGNTLGVDRLTMLERRHFVADKLRNTLASVAEMLGLDKRSPTRAFVTMKDQMMNGDEIKGGLRYVAGKVEKGAGDITTDTKWQVDGIVDQVAGGAQNLYGRAKEKVKDAIDDAPDALSDAGDRIRDVAHHGRAVADRRARENPWALVAAAGFVGYAVSWLVHGQR